MLRLQPGAVQCCSGIFLGGRLAVRNALICKTTQVAVGLLGLANGALGSARVGNWLHSLA